MLIIGKMIQHL